MEKSAIDNDLRCIVIDVPLIDFILQKKQGSNRIESWKTRSNLAQYLKAVKHHL